MINIDDVESEKKKWGIHAHFGSMLLAYFAGLIVRSGSLSISTVSLMNGWAPSSFETNRNVLQFATSWWIWIDALIWGYINEALVNIPFAYFWYWLPGVAATGVAGGFNVMNIADLRKTSLDYNIVRARVIKIWLFLFMVLGFMVLIGVAWSLAMFWLVPSAEASTSSMWTGIALLFQSAGILLAAGVYQFSRILFTVETEIDDLGMGVFNVRHIFYKRALCPIFIYFVVGMKNVILSLTFLTLAGS
jgi:hypothetical protein